MWDHIPHDHTVCPHLGLHTHIAHIRRPSQNVHHTIACRPTRGSPCTLHQTPLLVVQVQCTQQTDRKLHVGMHADKHVCTHPHPHRHAHTHLTTHTQTCTHTSHTHTHTTHTHHTHTHAHTHLVLQQCSSLCLHLLRNTNKNSSCTYVCMYIHPDRWHQDRTSKHTACKTACAFKHNVMLPLRPFHHIYLLHCTRKLSTSSLLMLAKDLLLMCITYSDTLSEGHLSNEDTAVQTHRAVYKSTSELGTPLYTGQPSM